MTPEEQLKLIDDLLDGDLSEADFLRLEAEMIVNEEARRAYYERQKLHAGLHLEANEAKGEKRAGESAAAQLGRRHSFRLDRFAVVALVSLFALGGFLGWKVGQDTQAAEAVSEPVVFGFGVLATESDVIWSGLPKLKEGDLVEKGILGLETGTAKLEFFNGVEVVLSGPAKFEVRSDLGFDLVSGEALFRVPSSVGPISVGLPSGKVRNSGHEFLVKVNRSEQRVEALSGVIEWTPTFKDPLRIEEGKGLQLNSKGEWSVVESSRISMSEIENRLSEKVVVRRNEWERSRDLWLEDDRVIAWYAFDEKSREGSQIVEKARNHSDGEMIRAAMTTNRWGESYGALDFSPTGSRVGVNVEGSFSSLTMMCWVRIDSLDRQFNSLFLTDGHERFEPHWQLMSDGRIFFSVKAEEGATGPDKHIAYSPSIWDRSRIGHWMQIATVFDGKAMTIAHYMNGAKVSEDVIPAALAPAEVRIGDASIGNWSQPRYRQTPEFAIRNLNGTMDELALFSEPLSAQEIATLYLQGKP